MFTKALILVLLGTTLVLANPVDIETQTEKYWKTKVQDWFHHVEDVGKEYYQKGKKSFEEALHELKDKSGKAAEISKEKLAELKVKYEELKENALVSFEEQKKIWEARLEEWKHKGADAFENGKDKFEELKEKAKVALKEEKAKLEAKFNQWKQQAKEAIEVAKEKYYLPGKKSFEEALQELKEKSGKAVVIGKEKYAELKAKFEELKEKALVSLVEQKKIWAARLDEWKHKGAEAFEQGKEKFEELKEKAKAALKEEKAKFEVKLNEWKQQVKEAIEAAKKHYNEAL